MTGPTAARRRGASAVAARLLLAATLAGALLAACGDGEVDERAAPTTDAEAVAAETSEPRGASDRSDHADPSDRAGAPEVLAAATADDDDTPSTSSSTKAPGPTTTTSTGRRTTTTTDGSAADATHGDASGTGGPGAAPDTTAPLSDEERIGAAQRLLLAHGYAIGEIDGEIGPATGAALAAFQAANGLAATGALDPATFDRLERASATLHATLPASVVVDLSEQQLYVFNAAGTRVTNWPISTGAPGSETPTGSYAVQARQRVGTAKDAETVHMDFFTVFNGNIGFHGIPWVGSRDDRLWTPLGEYGVSHGCIRMEDANAEYLYTFLADGAPVTVQD